MRKTILSAILALICFPLLSQELIVIRSEYLKCNDSLLVFTPDPAGRSEIPAVFLLHGWSGCYRNWSQKYDLQKISDRYGFRIICPDGFYNSWYLNNIDPEKMQWRTFFEKECYPQMKQRYGLKEELTFITGLSMGGHGAINLFFDHPQWFRAAGSMSGVLNLQQTSLKEKQISEVLGKYSPENHRFDEESALFRIKAYADGYPDYGRKPLVITCGYEDVFAGSASEFAERCEEIKIPHFFLLSKGNHSWKYWGFALEMHLNWFRMILENANLGY